MDLSWWGEDGEVAKDPSFHPSTPILEWRNFIGRVWGACEWGLIENFTPFSPTVLDTLFWKPSKLFTFSFTSPPLPRLVFTARTKTFLLSFHGYSSVLGNCLDLLDWWNSFFREFCGKSNMVKSFCNSRLSWKCKQRSRSTAEKK